MSWFRNITVKSKLLLSFTIVDLLTIGAGAYMFISMKEHISGSKMQTIWVILITTGFYALAIMFSIWAALRISKQFNRNEASRASNDHIPGYPNINGSNKRTSQAVRQNSNAAWDAAETPDGINGQTAELEELLGLFKVSNGAKEWVLYPPLQLPFGNIGTGGMYVD